jgi:protease-4
MGALLDDTFGELLTAVAEARKLPESELRTLVDRAPFSAKDALGAKLVDRIATHRQDTQRLAAGGSINWTFGKKKKETGTMRSLMELLKPSELTKPPKEPHVALVYAEGQIIHGPRRKGFGATSHVSSYHLTSVLEELRDSDRAKAVVLRIDSPGGSALASELIYQAVKELAKVKPVVVSMGDVAASGGYYIAAPASRILAQPGTITGSIGVVGGKFSLSGLFGKVGLTSEVLTRGARADLFNLARLWTPEERAVIQAHMAHTYGLFVSRVSEGRKLSPKEVEEVAQGRIWSGKAAKTRRLVDKLGGLQDAVSEAKQLAKLPSTAKTAVYPRPMTWIERLQEGLGATEAHAQAALGQAARLDPALAPLESLLFVLPAWQGEQVLAWLPILFTLR